jgi:O-methyltransferase / aklanonic acid methyltransferase
MTTPDVTQVAAVFDRAAATYDDAIPYFSRFGDRLVELSEVSSGDRVLDVACGRGASLIPAARRAGPTGEVVGIDLSGEMLERLRADLEGSGLGNVTVGVGNALDLPFNDGEFDIVQCGFTIMLLPDPALAAAEMARVLRPGGRLAWSMPTGAGHEWAFFQELVGSFAPRAKRPMPSPPGPPPDLDALAESAGLTDRTIIDEVEEFIFADPDIWWRWVWSQGMRALLEALDADDVEAFRRAGIERLRVLQRPDGSLPLHQRVRYLTAAKR